MGFRIVLLIAALIPVIYDAFTLRIIDRKRQEPLPEEVKDVYSAERWDAFVRYKHDLRRPHLISRAGSFLIDAVVILSPFYAWIGTWAGNNTYIAVFLSVLILTVLPLVIELPLSWYRCFRIEEKYGLNRKTNAEFWKDTAIDEIGSFVLMLGLYELLAFIFLHMRSWTDSFSISVQKGFLLTGGIILVLVCFLFFASWISWRLMRMRYHFTPMEEGELLDKIRALLKGSRKRVRRIEVYDESSKSTSKNAFVLKLPFYRSIGIADNFLNENSQDELLAVLAHEAGHLKHRPNFWNILTWILYGIVFLGALTLVVHGEQIAAAEQWIEQAFGMHAMNPVLTISIIIWLFQPIFFLFLVFRNYVSRIEEYEADRNAVKEGLGEPLIRTFKEISNDELVDVNPASVIEFLEYDHPGMANRIRAIRRAMEEGNAA